MAPDGVAHNGSLINMELVALLVGTDLGIAGACAGTGGDGVDGERHGLTQLHIVHADPAHGHPAPLVAAHLDDLIELHDVAVFQRTLYSGSCIRFGTDIQSAGGQADHTLGHDLIGGLVFLGFGLIGFRLGSGIIIQIHITQADPALVNAAPVGAAHRFELIDLHALAGLQITHNAAGGAGLGTDAQRTNGGTDGTGGDHPILLLGRGRDGFIFIFGIAEADPASLLQQAPLDIVGGDIIRHDVHGGALFEAAGGLGTGLGLGVDLQVAGGDAGIGGGGAQDVAAAVHFALVLLPVDVELLAVMAVVQSVDPLAAGGLGVPAQEAVAALGALRHVGCAQLAVIAQNADGSGGAQELGGAVVEPHIVIVGGDHIGINAVEIHVGFLQAALHQTLTGLSVGIGPEAKNGQEFVAGGAIEDGLGKHLGRCTVGPAGAHIICKGNQRVKLCLGKVQVVLLCEFVDGVNIIFQMLLQKLLGFGLGDAVFGVLLQLVIGTSGTVTNTVLLVIPVGFFGKTFQFFYQIDARICGFHSRSGMGRYREHAHEQDQDQHKNQRFTFHRSSLLCIHNLIYYIIAANETQEYK